MATSGQPIRTEWAYGFVAIAAAALLGLVLEWQHPQDSVLVSAVPLLLAVGGAYGRWRWSAACVFLWTAWFLAVGQQPSPLVEFGAPVLVLAYVIAHFRFLALNDAGKPNGSPISAETAAVEASDRPSAHSLVRTGAFLPFWPVAAVWFWNLILKNRVFFDSHIPPIYQFFISTLWTIGSIAIILAIGLHYYQRLHLTPAEAELELNDLAWTELRGDLRTASRYLADDERIPHDRR